MYCIVRDIMHISVWWWTNIGQWSSDDSLTRHLISSQWQGSPILTLYYRWQLRGIFISDRNLIPKEDRDMSLCHNHQTSLWAYPASCLEDEAARAWDWPLTSNYNKISEPSAFSTPLGLKVKVRVPIFSGNLIFNSKELLSCVMNTRYIDFRDH
jgi:hypothetical protein